MQPLKPGPRLVAGPFFADRAFTVRAEAYPLEPAPGTQDTEVAVRPAATQAVTTNPPVAAFARAAASDLGLAEAYFGQQGPSAAADTATENDPEDVVKDENGVHLEAHVDESPHSLAIAVGNGGEAQGSPSGSFSSRSEAKGAGPSLIATVEAEANDVVIGPFVLGSGRFEAALSLDGTPDGAIGGGTITTSDATFAGVPIVIDEDGFTVDETRVPAPLVGQATDSIQEFFSPGGYADIRVVQPKVEIAEDGQSVRVSGGGVHVFFTNNDPKERYFAGFTMLGGDAMAALGSVLSQPTRTVTVVTRPPTTAPAPPTSAAPSPVTTSPTPSTSIAPPPTVDADLATQISYDGGREVLDLRGIWPGLRWLVLAVFLLWAAVAVLQTPWLAGPRRSLAIRIDDFADRFTRG